MGLVILTQTALCLLLVFVCWHLNSSLWFRSEASRRQNEIGRGWQGATPLFHSAALEPRPPDFPLYNALPGNLLLPQGLILCFFTSAYLKNKSLLKDEILMKYFCFNRSRLETQCRDSDERKMVGNFRHCDKFVRADQAAPQSYLLCSLLKQQTLGSTSPALCG